MPEEFDAEELKKCIGADQIVLPPDTAMQVLVCKKDHRFATKTVIMSMVFSIQPINFSYRETPNILY